MEKVRVAMAGCGAITQRRHAPEYAANPDVEIAGFYDYDLTRAQQLAALYGGRAYPTYEEMVQDETIDAISICTPNSLHAEMGVAALKAGKHVLCEKPMAQSLEEAKMMLEAEKESGRILMLGHNQRLIPAHLKAKEIYESGMLGKALFYQCNFKHSGPENWSVDSTANTWFFDKSRAHFGVMGDLGAHKIDLIRFITGEEIERVFATMMTLDKRGADGNLIDLEDNVICQFRMNSGMPGIMHFSWTNYGQEDNSTLISGEKGVMKIYGDYADDIVLEMRDGTVVKYSVGKMSTNTNQLKSGVIDEFVAAIRENRKPLVTGIDGYNTLAVIEAGVQSSKEQTWVEVQY